MDYDNIFGSYKKEEEYNKIPLLNKENIMEDNNEYLEAQEVEYVQSAIQAGVQSTEILNVLVITECVLHCLKELVNAMETQNHVVMVVTPRTIQTIYTMKKVRIKQIQQEMSKIIRLDNGIQ